ncbi:alpha/beta-hydrolase, partial [Bimuria novae-zelandiae CBS 107.79]
LLATSALASAQKFPDYGIRECTDPKILALETDDCTDYHIFLARVSDSASPGHQGDLVRLVCDGIDGSCNYENIEYPANSSWSGEKVWCPSVATGVQNGQAQLEAYAERCPDSRLVLFGFSQGASVAMDILGGGGGPCYDCVQDDNPALDSSSSAASLLAAAAFGAPRRTGNQTYSILDLQDFDGTAVRTPEQLAGLAPYKDILREYCNNGDSICAPDSEPTEVKNHLSYFEKYQDEVADWVIGLAK